MTAYLENQNLTWSSTPGPTTSPVNALLLGAAKSLLQSIYTLSPKSADYLPWSYTRYDTERTAYVVHSTHPGFVQWPAVQGQQITWKSEPSSAYKGWSGVVTEAGMADVAADASTPAQCFTDCSGFITSLFTYVNNVPSQAVQTAFTGWQSGQANTTIPEAGCFNPDADSKNQQPNPDNYYRYFSTSTNGFQRVELGDVQPGDLLAWANTHDHKDTGHVMLIVAVADAPAGGGKFAVVADESSNHTDDTRGDNPGLGLGTIWLSLENNALKFYWSADSKASQIGPVAIGRAQVTRAA